MDTYLAFVFFYLPSSFKSSERIARKKMRAMDADGRPPYRLLKFTVLSFDSAASADASRAKQFKFTVYHF